MAARCIAYDRRGTGHFISDAIQHPPVDTFHGRGDPIGFAPCTTARVEKSAFNSMGASLSDISVIRIIYIMEYFFASGMFQLHGW
jgi:hypothetical protein